MKKTAIARTADFRRARDQVQAMNAEARSDTRPATLTLDDIEHAVLAYEPILPGWVIFPTQGKRPSHGLSWTERASADPVERAALAGLPHDGWAVACGPSDLCVIDLDVHDDRDGMAEWCGFLDTRGVAQAEGNPRILGVTPRGGRHLYYGGEGIGNRVAALPAVDVRGVGGYIVFAGPGRTLIIHDWAFPPLPGAVRDLLTVAPDFLAPSGVSRGSVVAALGRACDLVASAPDGRRNALLNWAAYVPGRDAIREGAPRESVEAVLLDAARECGLSEREAMATIRSGLGVLT